MNTNAMMNFGRRLILALGRGKSGKTLWSRWLVETMCARGLSPVAADADTVTHGLSRHHDGAMCLGSEPDALVAWWTTLTAKREEIAGRPVVANFSPGQGSDPERQRIGTGLRGAPRGARLRRDEGVLLRAGRRGRRDIRQCRRGCDGSDEAAHAERGRSREPKAGSFRRGAGASRHSASGGEGCKGGADAGTTS
jgi:hypothetical protein